jgi:hypothetical protein
MKAAIASILCLVAVLSGPVDGQQPAAPRISMIQLIANPEKFDGQLVSVVGFLTMGEEGTGLWLHETDFLNGIDADAVSVDRTKEMHEDRERLGLNYVLIEGTFQKNDRKLVGYPQTGRIIRVRRCDLWSNPTNPRRQNQNGRVAHP